MSVCVAVLKATFEVDAKVWFGRFGSLADFSGGEVGLGSTDAAYFATIRVYPRFGVFQWGVGVRFDRFGLVFLFLVWGRWQEGWQRVQ